MEFLKRHIPDNFILGISLGVVLPLVMLSILLGTVSPDLIKYSNSYLENVALLCIFINAAVMMLTFTGLEKDKTGKGLLWSNFIYIIAYVAYFYVL